jgi:hypothetical protein
MKKSNETFSKRDEYLLGGETQLSTLMDPQSQEDRKYTAERNLQTMSHERRKKLRGENIFIAIPIHRGNTPLNISRL